MNFGVMLFRTFILPFIRKAFDRIPYAASSTESLERLADTHPSLADQVVRGQITFQQALKIARTTEPEALRKPHQNPPSRRP